MDQQQQLRQENLNGNQLEQLIRITQLLLKDLIDSQGFQCQSIFNSLEEPQIQLSSFIRRIHHCTHFSPQCLIIAIIYLDRYNMQNPQFNLNYLNVHKIFLTCLLLSTKYHDDYYYDNKAFEIAGGVNMAQLFSFQVVFVQSDQFGDLLEKLKNVYHQQQKQVSETQ